MMKKCFKSSIFYVALFCLPMVGHAFKNEPVLGFNGVRWGAEVTKDFQFVKENPAIFEYFYVRKHDAKSYLGVPAEHIYYVFSFDNRFYKAEVKFVGERNLNLIYQNLRKQYGAGERVSDNQTRWSGEKILMNYFQAPETPNEAYLHVLSVETSNKTGQSIDATMDFLEKKSSDDETGKLFDNLFDKK